MSEMLERKPNDDYPRGYIEECFYRWYNAGRPSQIGLLTQCFPPVNNRQPDRSTIYYMIKVNNFNQRAEALDAEASRKTDETIIEQRVKMLEKHAGEAAEIRDKAFQFLKDNDFNTPVEALRAWMAAVEVERSSRGYADAIRNMTRMTDEQLVREIKKLSGGDDVIEAETTDVEESPQS